MEKKEVVKGLLVDIFKSSWGDSSNGGISAHNEKCLLVGYNIDGVVTDDGTYPVIKIVKRTIRSRPDFEYLTAYPQDTIGRASMFGGCFVYSSDSRFTDISHYPVPLHDRVE